MILDFLKRMDMTVVNTYFKRRKEHRVMYKSGERFLQVDYSLCRKVSLKETGDCNVVTEERVIGSIGWEIIG